MDKRAVEALNAYYQQAWEAAADLGLDPAPVEFELVPATAIFELASYGLPGHWHHWTYGRDYWLMKQRMERGYGRLYELVFNTEPARAYLLESNSMASQKLAIAHVLGHSDLFRNHERFRRTPKTMDQSMAATQERFRHYAELYGEDRLEQCIDRALSLRDQAAAEPPAPPARSHRRDPYADLWDGGQPAAVGKRTPEPRYPLPSRDLLGFLARYSPALEEWERDVLESVRQEALYFEPQRVTKLLHEGYATWVHHRLLEHLALSPAEAVEASRVHAQVIAPQPVGINPYRVGFQLLQHLAARLGAARMRAIALEETDASLIRNWLDGETVKALELYRYRWDEGRHPLGGQWAATWDAVVTDDPAEVLRADLANQLAYRGPEIVVEAVDNAMLVLRQVDDGLELDERWAQATLDQVGALWGGPVMLHRARGKPLQARARPGGR